MEIPRKTYYSISEVCGFTSLEPHVLRYWESEFPQLRPKKNRAGNRAYREKDIELIKNIKRLLYDEKFTIPGARQKLSEPKESKVIKESYSSKGPEKLSIEQMKLELKLPGEISMSDVKDELKEILKIVKPS